jgi:hypothetical protein
MLHPDVCARLEKPTEKEVHAMKHFLILSYMVLSSLVLAAQTAKLEGPFGFERGMTRSQVVSAIGSQAVRTEKGNTLVVTTAPKPNQRFGSYALAISPTEGLLKVLAIGKTIDTAEDGSEVRNAFNEVKEGLSGMYGAARIFDFCPDDQTGCKGDAYWMMSLKLKSRKLAAFWDFRSAPTSSRVADIFLDANSSSVNSGYVTVAFEFEGWAAYFESQRAKENTTY